MSDKFFVIADIHGFADLMKKGLDTAGFDPSNPNHVLVSLGDITDRGPQPIECLEYIMSCPRRILIRGNHDDLVQDLMKNKKGPGGHDYSNGTYRTVVAFAKKVRGLEISDTYAILDWKNVAKDARKLQVWKNYYNELVNYCEIGDYVLVHGWIPSVRNWRKSASEADWISATWARTPERVVMENWDDQNKTIICGHWHSEYFWRRYKNQPDNFSTYIDPHFIVMDACTAYSKMVNVLVIENGKVVDNLCVA